MWAQIVVEIPGLIVFSSGSEVPGKSVVKLSQTGF